MKKLLFVASLLLSIVAHSQVQNFSSRSFVNETADTLLYQILYPKNYNPSESYPLVIFLHGSGERGSDNTAQLTHGGVFFASDSTQTKYPAIVVFPQCPSGRSWSPIGKKVDPALQNPDEVTFAGIYSQPSKQTLLIMGLLKELQSKNNIDPDRMYLMGLSLGGYGTLDIITRYPGTFAAAVSICGGGNVSAIERIKGKTALWLTHGSLDTGVPTQYSRDIYKKLHSMGADVRYTEFEGVAHGAWYPTFALPDLLEWVFAKNKAK